MRIVPFAGWERCAQICAGDATAYVTLDVGPRVIGLTWQGGDNLFHVKPETRGAVGGEVYRGYGGHRLWVAPEVPERTYAPDNDPVLIEGSRFETSGSAKGWGRAITISVEAETFVLEHEIWNAGERPEEVAPWAVTVMRPGGVCAVPAHSRPDSKLPVRSLALWPYTRMDDPRFVWGPESMELHQRAGDGPTKIGVRVEQGIAAYFLPGLAFVKRFACEAGRYPDYDVNFEAYTRHDMLEVETLGVLSVLAPSERALHVERWRIFPTDAANPADRAAVLRDWDQQTW